MIVKQIEENLSRSPMMVMGFNSMAWAHSQNMAPLFAARIQGERGLLVVNTARRLQDRYSRSLVCTSTIIPLPVILRTLGLLSHFRISSSSFIASTLAA